MRKNRVTVYWVVTDESQSESRLVVSDSLWLHGILQARILEWVAFPLSRWSSQPRNQTQVSHTAGRFFINWAIREALLLMIDAYFLINPTGGPHSQCVNHNMQSLWPWGQERGCLHHNPPWQPQRHTDTHRFPAHSELNKEGSNEKQQLFCHENSLFHLISSSSSEVNTISPSWFSYHFKIGSSHTYTHTVSGPLFHCWQSLQTVITFYPLILLMYFSGFLPQIASHYSTAIATCSRKVHSFT